MSKTNKISKKSKYIKLIQEEKEYRQSRKFEKKTKSDKLIYRGAEGLKHFECRELERYNTSCLDYRKVAENVRNGYFVPIDSDERGIKVLIRYSCRYYVAVLDKKLQFIKTVLPPNCCDYLPFVQQYVDKFDVSEKVLAA